MRQAIEMSVCTYNDGTFDVILRDADTKEEVTLSGKQQLTPEEQELVCDLAPPCVYSRYAREVSGAGSFELTPQQQASVTKGLRYGTDVARR